MSKIRKAIVAGVGAAVAMFWTVAGGGLSADEIGQVVAAGVAVAWATWRVPNAAS